jgi:exosome complex component MTR3
MPLSNTTLSNCYAPIPSSSKSKESINLLAIQPSSRPSGVNNDKNKNNTRNAKSIRHLTIHRHILANSTGSSLVEIGHTKILCNVQGPRPISSSNASNPQTQYTTGSLSCQVRHAPFAANSLDKLNQATNLDGYSYGGASSNPAFKETELSSKLQDAIRPSIPLELIQKNVVEVFCLVLQDDGGVFPAMVIAASLALADAGVEVYDLVSAFSVAVIPRSMVELSGEEDDGEDDYQNRSKGYFLLADPSAREMLASESGGGVLTIAMMKSWKEVVFWDQMGSLPSEVVLEASELCREGCGVMHRFMRQALVGDGQADDADAPMEEQ